MFEYSSTEIIKNKVSHGLYLRESYYDFDISEMMEELRQDPFYDKFPDDQLIYYAIEKGLKETDTLTETIVENLRLTADERSEYESLKQRIQNNDNTLTSGDRDRYKELAKFANFTDDQLYAYAYCIRGNNSMRIHRDTIHSYTDKSKPEDPIWGQYSYEEILEMEAGGVQIPEDILAWAHGEQDADTSGYQIETEGNDDQNAVANLENKTNTESGAAVQKRSQAYSSQAESQQKLIDEKMDEVEPLTQNVVDKQEELTQEQNDTLQETSDLLEEWKILEDKAKAGTLSETERRRFEEISGILNNTSNNQFTNEIDKLDADINELVGAMDNITMLIDVNDQINTELLDSSVRMVDVEGSKKRGYLGDKKDFGNFGETDTIHAQALSSNIGFSAALKGIDLNSDNILAQTDVTENNFIAQQVTDTVQQAKRLVDESDTQNIASESRIVLNEEEETDETQNEEKIEEFTDVELNQEEEIAETGEENETAANAENTSAAANMTFANPIVDEVNNRAENGVSLRKTTSEQIQDETEPTPVDEDGNRAVLPSETRTTVPAAGKGEVVTIKPSAETEGVSDTTAAAETSEVSDTAEGTESTETMSQEDTQRALISEYITGCDTRQAEINNSQNELDALAQQIKEIKDTKFSTDIKLTLELKKKTKDLERIAQKARSGQELSSSDIAKFSELNSFTNVESGEYMTTLQGRLDILNAYNSGLENLNKLTESSQVYASQAIEAGKAYAREEMGDTKALRHESVLLHFKKEKTYDALYGKAGESLGRDLIDRGEALQSTAEKKPLSGASIKSMIISKFAKEYAQTLNSRLVDASQSLEPLQADILAAIQAQSQEAQNNTVENAAETASGQEDSPVNQPDVVPENTNTVLTESAVNTAVQVDENKNTQAEDINSSAVPESPDETNEAAMVLDSAVSGAAEKFDTDNESENTADINVRIARNNANAETIENLNGVSDSAQTTLTNNVNTYETLSDEIEKNEENGLNNITLNTDKISPEETSPSQLRLAQNVSQTIKAVSGDSVFRISDILKTLQPSSSLIDSISDTVDDLVAQSSQNPPDFGFNNIFLKNRFASSVASVMAAAANNNSNNFATTVLSSVVTNANNILAPENNSADSAEEISNETAKTGVDGLAAETASENDDTLPEEKIPAVVAEDDSIDEEAIPVFVDENATEKDLESEMVDEIYAESEENQNMLNSYNAKLAMEKQAQDAAKTALNETTDRGGFKASGSATVSMGNRLQSADRKSETGRTRRFISYEDKNRRAALADKVEDSKKVVMKRGQKKNS